MGDDFLLFVAVGFAAQMVDGALGMGYGLTSTTVLLSMGTPPAIASASVHTAEIFTTAASGASHWHHRNVDHALLKRLVLPGMAGGVLGAYVLTSFPGETLRPIVSAYLLCMGIVILWRAWRKTQGPAHTPRQLLALGFAGGFLDASGGGGWGPLVASTLVGRGVKARYIIGTTNLAEFFITTTISATFVATIGLELWPIITGLILGGVVAAPLAAYVTKHVPDKPMMVLVGALIFLLSARNLVSAIFN